MKVKVFNSAYVGEKIEIRKFSPAIKGFVTESGFVRCAKVQLPKSLLPPNLRWHLLNSEDIGWIGYKNEKIHPLLPQSKISFVKKGFFISHPLMEPFYIPFIKEFELPDLKSEILKDIFNIYEYISLPFVEEVFEAKKNAIMDLLPKSIYIKGQGVIVPAKSEKRLVIISHMDLIPKFNKGFFHGKKLTFKENEVKGALDNTITNAVLIYLIKKGLPDYVEVLFSVGEETGGHGARSYLNSLDKKNIGFINLDVTNEGEDSSISIEYDRPNSQTLEYLFSLEKELDAHVTDERFPDDLDQVHMCGYNGISACLPTKGEIHSYKNRTTLEKIEKYTLALERLIKSGVNFGKKSDLSKIRGEYRSLDAKGMVKAEKKETKKQKSLLDDYCPFEYKKEKTKKIDLATLIGDSLRELSLSLIGGDDYYIISEVAEFLNKNGELFDNEFFVAEFEWEKAKNSLSKEAVSLLSELSSYEESGIATYLSDGETIVAANLYLWS